MNAKEWLDRLVSDQEYRLKQAIDAWENCLTKIRDNPNQLNVHGLWVGDFLSNMEKIRVLVAERHRQLAETKAFLAEMDNPATAEQFGRKGA